MPQGQVMWKDSVADVEEQVPSGSGALDAVSSVESGAALGRQRGRHRAPAVLAAALWRRAGGGKSRSSCLKAQPHVVQTSGSRCARGRWAQAC